LFVAIWRHQLSLFGGTTLTKAALRAESRFRRLGIYKRGEIMALGLIVCAIAASATASALAGAGSTVGAADALHAAPLFLSDVPDCETNN